MPVTDITDMTFDKDVRQSKIPVLVDFHAAWCGPCKNLSPILDEIADEMKDKIKIVKIDVDSNPDSATNLGVRGIPALFLFKDGEIVANRAGADGKIEMKKWIEENL